MRDWWTLYLSLSLCSRNHCRIFLLVTSWLSPVTPMIFVQPPSLSRNSFKLFFFGWIVNLFSSRYYCPFYFHCILYDPLVSFTLTVLYVIQYYHYVSTYGHFSIIDCLFSLKISQFISNEIHWWSMKKQYWNNHSARSNKQNKSTSFLEGKQNQKNNRDYFSIHLIGWFFGGKFLVFHFFQIHSLKTFRVLQATRSFLFLCLLSIYRPAMEATAKTESNKRVLHELPLDSLNQSQSMNTEIGKSKRRYVIPSIAPSQMSQSSVKDFSQRMIRHSYSQELPMNSQASANELEFMLMKSVPVLASQYFDCWTLFLFLILDLTCLKMQRILLVQSHSWKRKSTSNTRGIARLGFISP